MTEGFSSLDIDSIAEKTENSISVVFSIPPDSPYYDGHFYDYPILPAVAQMEIVTRIAAQHLGTPVTVQEIKRMKFSTPLHPSVQAVLKIELKNEKNKQSLNYNISSRDSQIIYSQGTIITADL